MAQPRAPRKGKLRNRIFIAILIGLIPAAVAAAFGVYAVAASHRADVARLESAVLEETAAEITSYVNGQILSAPAVITPTGSGIGTDVAAQQFALEQTLRALPFVQSESFVNLFGAETARVDRAHPDGYPSSSLRDLSASPAFQAARAGNYYLGAASYGPQGPSVAFAAPARDAGGNLFAVTMGVASLSQVQKIVAAAKVGGSGYLYLVDGAGNVIGGGGPVGAAAAANAIAGATSGPASIVNEPIVEKVVGGASLATADTQMDYRNIAGVPVVAAAEPVAPYGWGLVAEWPTAEADAVVNQLFVQSAIVLGIILLLVLAVAAFLGGHIARPVAKLREAAARVAQGDLKEGVAIATGDELESLGDSFNDMMQGLKRLEELKDEFVFVAAHELRTPVAAMKGYLSLILDGTTGAVSDAAKQYIEKVIASDDRLAQLVNDLLEVARSEAGRLTIKVAPTDIAPPVRATFDELKSLADGKQVKLVYEPPADLPKVMADADRIREVMVNLVGNAIKYMGGAGTVTVSHEVENTPAGKELVTRVADTGLGISKEAQAKLFTKFYRAQTEKTRDITGTGLGLFIVREIVEKMGGTIAVRSEEGKGATFSFGLPVAAAS